MFRLVILMIWFCISSLIFGIIALLISLNVKEFLWFDKYSLVTFFDAFQSILFRFVALKGFISWLMSHSSSFFILYTVEYSIIKWFAIFDMLILCFGSKSAMKHFWSCVRCLRLLLLRMLYSILFYSGSSCSTFSLIDL